VAGGPAHGQEAIGGAVFVAAAAFEAGGLGLGRKTHGGGPFGQSFPVAGNEARRREAETVAAVRKEGRSAGQLGRAGAVEQFGLGRVAGRVISMAS
jgi:hypothetical protein